MKKMLKDLKYTYYIVKKSKFHFFLFFSRSFTAHSKQFIKTQTQEYTNISNSKMPAMLFCVILILYRKNQIYKEKIVSNGIKLIKRKETTMDKFFLCIYLFITISMV